MKFYLAPMEGLTGYIYRNAHAAFFKGVDKYFTPFISPNQHGSFLSREISDVLPEHNEGIPLVPQILSNKADEFLATVKWLEEMGYEEVNLNLGCPSGTVVTKFKGSGFLAVPDQLNAFLDQIFEKSSVKISIKTRLGVEQPEEFEKLMPIFNQYPLEELIIHPRVQKDYYKNKPRMAVFKEAAALSTSPVGYNGDLFTLKDYEAFHEQCPKVERLMLGRGLIANPGMVEMIQEGKILDKAVLKAFHDRLYEDYQGILSGQKNVLFKMKENWFYMGYMFTHHEKYVKKIRKSQTLKDYERAVEALFEQQEILPEAGMFYQENSK